MRRMASSFADTLRRASSFGSIGPAVEDVKMKCMVAVSYGHTSINISRDTPQKVIDTLKAPENGLIVEPVMDRDYQDNYRKEYQTAWRVSWTKKT